MGEPTELPVKEGQGAPQSVGHVIRQAEIQGCRGDAGPVGGRHIPQGFGGPPRQEVAHSLGGCPEAAASQGEGGLLPPALELHPGQGVRGAEVGGLHPHQKAAVDVGSVPGAQAHAVGHQPALLRGGGHHLPAGAHAEGEGAAAAGQVTGQLVVRRRQAFPRRAELGLRHGGLAVLDAYPDGEGLGGHGHPGVQQHPEGVPGGVAGGEHQRVTGQGVGPAGALHGQPGQRPAADVQPRQLMAEAHVAAQGEQLLPQAAHHLPQHVGADVGLVLVEDVRRGPRLHQGAEHGGNAGVVGAGGQLAVGEGARAPLSELHVGGGIQHAGGPELFHVRRPLLHRAAPLQHDGGQAVPGQEQGGEQPRRAHARHHRRQGGAPPHRREYIGPGRQAGAHPLIPAAGQQLFLSLHHGPDGADVVDVALLPGVDGQPHQLQGLELLRADAQQLGRPLFQLGGEALHGQGHVLNLQHGCGLRFSRVSVNQDNAMPGTADCRQR